MISSLKLDLNLIVFILALFPYSPNLIEFSDIEPTCLTVCVIYLATKVSDISIHKLDIAWIAAAIFALGSSLLIAATLTDVRLFIGGASFILFFLYGYNFVHRIGVSLLQSIIAFFVKVWIAISFFQILGIGFEFLSPNRTTEGRGLTSLAAEATYAGLHIICVVTLSILIRRSEKEFIPRLTRDEAIASFLPLVFHASSTALACYIGGLITSLSIKSVSSLKFLRLTLLSSLVTGALLFFLVGDIDSLQQSITSHLGSSSMRIFSIWESVITGSIMQDASAADRLSSTLKFLLSPYVFPQTINHQFWVNDVNTYLAAVGSLHVVNYDYRNLSGLGQLNVVLGFFMLLPLRGILSQIVSSISESIVVSSIFGSFLFALLFSTPLSHPLFGLLLGLSCRISAIRPATRSLQHAPEAIP